MNYIMKINFEIAINKSINVNTLEDLVNRFIEYKWLRLELNLWDYEIIIVNNSYIAWEWFEYAILKEWESSEFTSIESFNDMLDEIINNEELSKEIWKKFINWILSNNKKYYDN
jgi:hypothetical protein